MGPLASPATPSARFLRVVEWMGSGAFMGLGRLVFSPAGGPLPRASGEAC